MLRALTCSLLLVTCAIEVSSGTTQLTPFIVLDEITTIGDPFSVWLEDRANHYGFEISLIHRLIRVESNWDPRAVSYANAYGLMQLLLPTAREILEDPTITPEHLLGDRYLNCEAGMKYLRWLKGKFRGNMKLALLSYNRGIGKVTRELEAGKNPSNGYELKVLGLVS